MRARTDVVLSPALRDEAARIRDAWAGSVGLEGGGNSVPTLGGGVGVDPAATVSAGERRCM
jgi:hypothetical protein